MSGRSRESAGILFGLVAYTLWGLVPAYWKELAAYPSTELIAQRVLWSLVVALALLAWTRGFATLRAVFRTPRHALPVVLAGSLLGGNWLVFVYAVSSDQVVATSLGYYLNPLLNVVLGLVVLGERLRPVQGLAVAIAAFGVGYYIFQLGELPWIALVLAGSFGLYGLVRKTTPVDPIVGFGVEMSALALPCAAFVVVLALRGESHFATVDLRTDLLFVGTGLVTAVPLLCFNAAAKRLPLITVGILQYIAPSMTLVLAVVAYREPFESVHAVVFGCVWTALAIFTLEAFLNARRGSVAAIVPVATIEVEEA